MMSSTRAAHSTKSADHGRGARSSFASSLRRKGSALASLSSLFRKLRSHRRHSNTSHTSPTDPTEERPFVRHLEDACPPPCESWSNERDDSSSRHRKKQFWTVSGARSGSRCRSTDIEFISRLSRARSLDEPLGIRESVLEQEDYTTTLFPDLSPPGCARDLRFGLHDPSGDPVDMTMSPLYLAYGYICEDFQTWKNSNRVSGRQLTEWNQKLEQLRALIDSLAETIPPAQAAGMVQDEALSSEQVATSMDGNPGSNQSSGIERSGWNTSECTATTDEVSPGPPPTPVNAVSNPVNSHFEYEPPKDYMGPCDPEAESIRPVYGPHRSSLEYELLQVGESFDGNGNVGATPDGSMLTV